MPDLHWECIECGASNCAACWGEVSCRTCGAEFEIYPDTED